MNDILVKLDEHDKRIVNDLCAEYICGSRIILEDYISVENLLGLLEELHTYIENKKEEKEQEHHIEMDEYDEVIERELLGL